MDSASALLQLDFRQECLKASRYFGKKKMLMNKIRRLLSELVRPSRSRKPR
jgi:hypothetical protein